MWDKIATDSAGKEEWIYVEIVLWHVNGSMVNILCGRSTEEELAKYKRPSFRGGKRRLPIRFRTSPTLRNMSTENTIRKLTTGPTLVQKGHRKIVLDKCNNSEAWKAVEGYWDGSFKDNGENGCQGKMGDN